MGKAGYEAGLYGIGNARYENGDRRRGVLGRLAWRRVHSQDDVHLELHEVIGQSCKPLILSPCIPRLDSEVFPVDVTKLPEPFLEALKQPRGKNLGGENANAIHPSRLLRLGDEWRS